MVDARKASEMSLARLVRTIGAGTAQRPGTLSPDPWHFALCASSMVQKQGDATARATSPMPLDCRGARGACQQSPVLRRSNLRLPTTRFAGKNKGQGEYICHPVMLLAQSEKCRGFGGRATKNPGCPSGLMITEY